MTFIGKKLRHKVKKKCQPGLMKLCILVAYKFLTKKIMGSVHFWSCDITKYEIYKICHISAILKDRDFWFGPKNSIKLCAEQCTCGHQVHFWSRDCALIFSERKVPISLKRLLLDNIYLLFIDRNMHIIFHLAP